MATFDLMSVNGDLRRTFNNVDSISTQASGVDQNLVKLLDKNGQVISVISLVAGERLDRKPEKL